MTATEEPLISCLCVTENRLAFMPWLLWNYDRQSWAKRELVIVDSSTTPYQSDRPDVRVVGAPPGTGVGAKRNLALEHARGIIVTWFDDDDWQHPQKLSLLADALADERVVYAGARHAWFVDLAGGGCTRYRGSGGQPVFNSAGFRLEAVRSVRFSEKRRKASDTRWMQALRQRYPSRMALLPKEDLFFWLCHGGNLSNPAGRRRFPKPLHVLQEMVGEGWGDTGAALAGLRERLAGARVIRPTVEVKSVAPETTVMEPANRKEPIPEQDPAVSLMIKATVLDAPYLDVMARHMIAQARYPFAERVIVVERRADFSGKYRRRNRASDADLDRVLEGLLNDKVIDRVREVDATPGRVQAVMARYFRSEAARVPTHANTGGPIYATLYGLESMDNDFVVQMDTDVFFYGGQASWVAQALRCMRQDPRLWLMMTHPGPPAGPPGRSLSGPNRNRASWDARLQLWRFSTATTRYFLCDRRRLRGRLRPVFRGNGCVPLEQCISQGLQSDGAFRGNLGDLQSWHLHAWTHADPFPEWAAALAETVAAGSYPALQAGRYDLRLDRARDRRAWQALLPSSDRKPAKPAGATTTTPARRTVSATVVDDHRDRDQAPLAAIMPVRDRAGQRLALALHSLNWQSAGRPAQILVVSYGSRPEIDRELGRLCRQAGATLLATGKPDAPWNKSLALNVGIRAVREEIPYLMTMDADMILAPDFFAAMLKRLQSQPPALVLCRSLDLPQRVRLPANEQLAAAFDQLRRQARPRGRSGTGGIQAAHRDFFFQVRGYDEDLLWWGAMDGDMVNRARLMGLAIAWIDDETSMLHQWHPRKWRNLSHRGLSDPKAAAAAQRQWRHNHRLAKERARTARRNSEQWGRALEMPLAG